jgi:hypothetical protein
VVVVEIEVFFGKRFDVAVFIPDSAGLTKACGSMTVTSLQ